MRNYLVKSGRGFWDSAFDSWFAPVVCSKEVDMKTDIKEFEDRYELAVEMPGFDKEDIQLELNDGYLTVSAQKKEEESEENGQKYLRKERSVSCSRNFYVDNAELDGVKAKYVNGILNISVSKPKAKEPDASRILIE